MTGPITSGRYYIMNYTTQNSLNENMSGGPGTAVVMATAPWSSKQTNSVWEVDDKGDGTYKIWCVYNFGYLWASDDKNDSPVQVWEQNDNPKQSWILKSGAEQCAPTYMTIQNVDSSLFLDCGAGSANGTQVVTAQPNGGNQQKWVFVPSH